MKTLYLLAGILLSGCAAQDAIQMKETPLRLERVEKSEIEDNESLFLEWTSLDGNIRIKTQAPLKDSSQYEVGEVYGHCFLRK